MNMRDFPRSHTRSIHSRESHLRTGIDIQNGDDCRSAGRRADHAGREDFLRERFNHCSTAGGSGITNPTALSASGKSCRIRRTSERSRSPCVWEMSALRVTSIVTGSGRRPLVDLPAEVGGLVRDTSEWTKTSIGSIAIGQEVSVTPAADSRHGFDSRQRRHSLSPYVVQKIQDPSGETTEIKPSGTRVMSPTTARAGSARCWKMWSRTVPRKASQLEGYRAAGKTGTAQKVDPATKRYSPSKHIASFAGFAPVSDPQDCNRRRRRRAQGAVLRRRSCRARIQAHCRAGAADRNPCCPMFRAMLRTTRPLQKGQTEKPTPIPGATCRTSKFWMPP